MRKKLFGREFSVNKKTMVRVLCGVLVACLVIGLVAAAVPMLLG